MLIDDITMDLAPFITAEPALSDDRAYVREVFASPTPDQIKKYADGETTSALTMMQNVMKSIADTKMSVYITHATTFSIVTTTIDSHVVLGRFKNFTATLGEVRFHKLFELKDAVKKIVAVIAPNVFLVNEVIAMWSVSTKDQAALTAVMTYVMDEVDVPGAEFPSRKKDKGGKGDRDRTRTPNNNGSRWKPGSGTSYSNSRNTDRQGNGGKWRDPPSRQSFNEDRRGSQRNETTKIDHVRAVQEAREQLESEARERERSERARYDDSRYEALADQLDAITTAQTIAGFSGDVLNSIDANVKVASVMQVSTRNSSSKDRVTRASSDGAAAAPEI